MSEKKLSAWELMGRAGPMYRCFTGDEPVSAGVGSHGFGLVFRYGLGSRDELNTFSSTYTRVVDFDVLVTTRMVLTDEEMEKIRQKMLEIDFFSYPDDFSVPPGKAFKMISPGWTYSFLVKHDSAVKVLNWDDVFLNGDDRADALRELINLIRTIIESKVEYKELPESRIVTL